MMTIQEFKEILARLVQRAKASLPAEDVKSALEDEVSAIEGELISRRVEVGEVLG